MQIKLTLLALIFVFISGCSTIKQREAIESSRDVEVLTVNICENDNQVIYDRPDGLSLVDVEFIVINEDFLLEEYLASNEAGVLMTIQNYENLGINMQELLRYIRQMDDLVNLYEGYSDIIP